MNNELLQLQPERLWYYFTEILKIPRPSKKEEKILAYLLEFGKQRNLETLQDAIGNILIRKPATEGMENRKSVVLQSHVDMVCEKNSDVDFDFNNDAIKARIDGEWVKATGTTLGADDGIGIAAQLAILEAKDIPHGPIECLFTIDEETGLTGAFGLKSGFLQSTILLNLDSEDEGELFIGCAGGKDTVIKMTYKKETISADHQFFKVIVKGLVGGHSGDDIQKGRANANKLVNRILYKGINDFDLLLADINGGNLRNAIAREAYAIVGVPSSKAEEFKSHVMGFNKTARAEYHVTEPNLSIEIENSETPVFVIDNNTTKKLIWSLYACPHGVIAWSADIPNFVETSTNLAAVKCQEDKILITTSQRSSVESAKEDIGNMVASVFNLAGAKVEHSEGYPGWTPNPDSEIVEISRNLYSKLFGQEPKVLAIHAGLECGLIGDVYPGMDMISFGPTIKGAHSPDERLNIKTARKFWDLTLAILENIPSN